MPKYLIVFYFLLATSCSKYNKVEGDISLPVCLQERIKNMAKDPSLGSPIRIMLYTYHEQKVYYMVSPCCDQYNIVFDNNCTILGYPDGGFTGRGDGKLPDFFKEATEPKVIWELKKED